MTVEDRIKAEASSLGFALCGFSRADTPPHYGTYLDWIEAGHHAGMAYMARPNASKPAMTPPNSCPGAALLLAWAQLILPLSTRKELCQTRE